MADFLLGLFYIQRGSLWYKYIVMYLVIIVCILNPYSTSEVYFSTVLDLMYLVWLLASVVNVSWWWTLTYVFLPENNAYSFGRTTIANLKSQWVLKGSFTVLITLLILTGDHMRPCKPVNGLIWVAQIRLKSMKLKSVPALVFLLLRFELLSRKQQIQDQDL